MKYWVFVLAIIVWGCGTEEKKGDDEKTEAQKENTGPCNCDDLVLDPDFNHFFLNDDSKGYTGKCQTFYKSEQMAVEKNLANGKVEGIMREWYENGQLKTERSFAQNVQHGELKEWNEKGELIFHAHYTHGNIDKIISRAER
jgi:hypothetical protein